MLRVSVDFDSQAEMQRLDEVKRPRENGVIYTLAPGTKPHMFFRSML